MFEEFLLLSELSGEYSCGERRWERSVKFNSIAAFKKHICFLSFFKIKSCCHYYSQTGIISPKAGVSLKIKTWVNFDVRGKQKN